MKNTNKIIGLISVFMLILACGGVSAYNIVKNNGFESGALSPEWAAYTVGESYTTQGISTFPNPVYDGVYSGYSACTGGSCIPDLYLNSTEIDILSGMDCVNIVESISGINTMVLHCHLGTNAALISYSFIGSMSCNMHVYNTLNGSIQTNTTNTTYSLIEQANIKSFSFSCHNGAQAPGVSLYLDDVIINVVPAECNTSADCGDGYFCLKATNTCQAKIANLGSCGLAVECSTTNDCNISCLSGIASYGVCSESDDANALRVSSIINQCNNISNTNHTWISNLMQAATVTSVNGVLTNATAGNVTINQESGATVWGLITRTGLSAGAGCVIAGVATIWTDGGAAGACVAGAIAGGVIGAGSYIYDAYNPSIITGVSMNGYTGTNLSVNYTTSIEAINNIEVNCGWHKIVKISSNVNTSQSVPVRLNFDKFYYGFARVESLSGDEFIGYATDSMNESMVYYNNSIKASVIQICGGVATEYNASFDMKNYNPINVTGYYKGLLLLVNYPYNVSCNNFLYIQWSLYQNETLAAQITSNKWNVNNFTLSVNNSWNYNDGYIYRGVKLSNGNNFFTNLNNYTSNNDYNVSAGNYNYYHVYGSNNDSIIGEYWLNNIDDNIFIINYIFRQETLNLTNGYLNYSDYLNTSITSDNLFQQAYFNVSGNVIKILMNVPFNIVNASGVTQFQLNNSYVNRRLSVIVMDGNKTNPPITEITAAGDILTNEIGVTNPLITPVLRENQTVIYDSLIYNGSNTYIVNNYYVIDNNTRGYETTNLTGGFMFMFPQATPAAAGTSSMLYFLLVAVLAVVLIYVFTNLKGGGKSTGRRKR
jgi:hypothetical protein